MKSRRFMLSVGLGWTAAALLGCTKTAQQPSLSPSAAPSAASSATASAPAASTEMAQGEAKLLRSGSFVTGEHETTGTAQIVERAGKRVLELDAAFATTAGPDLVVILHRSADVIGSTQSPAHSIQPSDWLLLAPLQQSSGAQSYEIPDTVNLDEFQSAAIWCRQFNATFGAASLKA